MLKRISPAIGYFKLSELKPQHLNALYEQLGKDGLNKNTGKTLSNKTILEHHRLIRTILAQAEKELLVQYNAAIKATPPKVEKKEANYLQIEDIENILFYLSKEPLKQQAFIILLIFTGFRRGEIMGLKWDKIDFKNNLITIDTNLLYSKERGIYEDTPKTEQSKRTISVPIQVMNILKAYRKEYNTKRLSLGSCWHDTNFVFVQENGKPMHPDSLTDYCYKFTKKYNQLIEKENKNKPKSQQIKLLPHINPHAFWHTQASMLILNGVDITTVSKRLGHAKTSTTADIYSHLMQKADESASNTLEDILLKKNEIKSNIAN